MSTGRNLKLLSITVAVFSWSAAGLQSAQAANLDTASCGNWKLVAGPADVSELRGVVALSASNVWAVGSDSGPDGDFREPIPLVEHWDGSAWSTAQTPSLPSGGGLLESVSADSSKDAWAVGNQLTQSGTLIEHWSGSQWSLAAAAPVNGYNANFAGVTALTKSNAWAVGGFYQTPKNPGAAGVGRTLIEHWNGHRWSVVASPSPGKPSSGGNYPAFSNLQSVVAVSSTNIWAVGEESTSSSEAGLIEHWNGSTWKVVRSTVPGSSQQTMYGVAAVNARDIWAVGNFYAGTQAQPLAQQWNGSRWVSVATQHVNTTSVSLNQFYGVTAPSASDIWAVGAGLSKGFHALIEHWDGAKWTVVSNPAAPDKNGVLFGVSAVGNVVWAVGQKGLKRSPALIEQFRGCSTKS